MELSKPEDIGSTFSKVVMGKRRKTFTLSELAEKKQKILLDKEHFIPYQPADVHTEEGLQVHNFQKEASVAGFDLTGDTEAIMKSAKVKKVWDKKKKKMVGVQGESKKNMIKSESGKWIPSSYKSGRYQKWMEKTKAAADDDAGSDDGEAGPPKPLKRQPKNERWAKHNLKLQMKKQVELKRPEQIAKAREIQERKRKRSKPKRKGKRGKKN
uniref:ATP-dependent RNA helicase DDX54 n=1 Tax=Lygus hesperus TaxID=30085 RepID=A0A146MF53_LYGHE